MNRVFDTLKLSSYPQSHRSPFVGDHSPSKAILSPLTYTDLTNSFMTKKISNAYDKFKLRSAPHFIRLCSLYRPFALGLNPCSTTIEPS